MSRLARNTGTAKGVPATTVQLKGEHRQWEHSRAANNVARKGVQGAEGLFVCIFNWSA